MALLEGLFSCYLKRELGYCKRLWTISRQNSTSAIPNINIQKHASSSVIINIHSRDTIVAGNAQSNAYFSKNSCTRTFRQSILCEYALRRGGVLSRGTYYSIPCRNMVTDSIGAKIRGIQKDILPLSTKRIVRRKRPKDSVAKEQAIFSVTAYATSEEINLETLMVDLERQGLYAISKLPKDATDALHVTAKYKIEGETREIFFFREGSVVFWNVTDVERQNVLHFLRRHQDDAYDARLIQQEFEAAEYSYTDTPTTITGDEFQLRKTDQDMDLQLEKYAFSNALASSVKLSIWEASLARYVDSIEGVLQDLKEGNKVKISRSEVLKKMGEVYTLRHLVNLSSDLLDPPDFYWDREPLENLYIKTARHHSIPRRVKVINEKLNLCCEMMGLLMTQLNDKHHIRLEWMIILLILVEVLFEVGKLSTGHG